MTLQLNLRSIYTVNLIIIKLLLIEYLFCVVGIIPTFAGRLGSSRRSTSGNREC